MANAKAAPSGKELPKPVITPPRYRGPGKVKGSVDTSIGVIADHSEARLVAGDGNALVMVPATTILPSPCSAIPAAEATQAACPETPKVVSSVPLVL